MPLPWWLPQSAGPALRLRGWLLDGRLGGQVPSRRLGMLARAIAWRSAPAVSLGTASSCQGVRRRGCGVAAPLRPRLQPGS